MGFVGQPLTELIGNTPLIALRRLGQSLPAGVQLSLKAEWYNPGGSVKDRAAWNIVRHAQAQGLLGSGRRLLDASSGNTGIAYAMLGAALGFGVTLCLPGNASAERKKTLAILGTEIIATGPTESTDGAIVEARRLFAAYPDRYFYADQYKNPHNWQAHYENTGPEVWRQSGKQLTHFVVGLGTTGTCMGVGRYLREVAPEATVVAVQPAEPLHGLEGLKHLESAMVPPIYDAAIPHQQAVCTTLDAYAMVRRLALEEGLIAGISTGAALHVALGLATQEAAAGRNGCIVVLAPDGGARYLSDPFWLAPKSHAVGDSKV